MLGSNCLPVWPVLACRAAWCR